MVRFRFVSLCGCISFLMPLWLTAEQRAEVLKAGRLRRLSHNRRFPECDTREHRDPVWSMRR